MEMLTARLGSLRDTQLFKKPKNLQKNKSVKSLDVMSVWLITKTTHTYGL